MASFRGLRAECEGSSSHAYEELVLGPGTDLPHPHLHHQEMVRHTSVSSPLGLSSKSDEPCGIVASLVLQPDKSVVDVGCHWGACSSAQCPPAGHLKFGPSLDSRGQKAHRRILLQGIDGPHKHTPKRTAAKSSQSLAQAYGKPGVSLGREQVGATSPTSSHQEIPGNALTLEWHSMSPLHWQAA